MSYQEYEGRAAAYRPVDSDEAVPGTIVEIQEVADSDGDHRRVILDVGDGKLVNTAFERVDIL